MYWFYTKTTIKLIIYIQITIINEREMMQKQKPWTFFMFKAQKESKHFFKKSLFFASDLRIYIIHCNWSFCPHYFFVNTFWACLRAACGRTWLPPALQGVKPSTLKETTDQQQMRNEDAPIQRCMSPVLKRRARPRKYGAVHLITQQDGNQTRDPPKVWCTNRNQESNQQHESGEV